MRTCGRIFHTLAAVILGASVLSSTAFAQPVVQTKFIVRFSDQSMAFCGAAGRTYIDTHPNRSNTNALTFFTYAAALQAAKDMPCDGFSTIRLGRTFHGQAYGGAGLPWHELAVTVVEDFEAHEPSIADPVTAHRYHYGTTVVVAGPYDERVSTACNGFCTAAGAVPHALAFYDNDQWSCTCRTGSIYLPSTLIQPHCAQPMFGYEMGQRHVPKTAKCRWLGGVAIYSVNADPSKSIEATCPTAHRDNPQAGNPINLAHGIKTQLEPDYRDPRGLLDVTRTYASSATFSQYGWLTNWASARPAPKQGGQTGYWSISFFHPSGRRMFFGTTAASFTTLTPPADVKDVLTVDGSTFRVRRVRDGWVDHYGTDLGLGNYEVGLIRRQFANGSYVDAAYAFDPENFRINGITLRDQWGRTVYFTVHSLTGRIVGARLPGNELIEYSYDGVGATARAVAVALPDGSRRHYHYNEPEHTSGANFPIALTGISVQGVTGDPARFSTYRYDALGRAISTEHAGDANRYSVNYVTPNQQSIVTDPLGSQRTLNLTSVVGNVLPTSQSQPAGSGCGPSSSAISYDAQANVTSRTDFNGQKICYAHDLARNVETKRVEGLAASANCSTALSSPPTGSRVISTQWHPDWDMPTRIAEPKRITTTVYNGYGAACAPATALVDGRPIAVVCSRTEQATTDETGSSGFSASATGTPRTWSYAYTAYGQVLTATDPNNRTTSTTYYAENHPDLGKRGSVATITNAANHITEITDYNPHGQPTRLVDPNGLVIELTYDLRQRLRTHAVGNEVTRFDYNVATNKLTQVELPDAATVNYGYDDAQRLTSIADHKGNRVDYTLDPMGNRTAEQVRDPGGTLVKNIARVIDALNRVERLTGAVQ